MFQKLGWMPVGSRINYNKAVLTYKALNNMTPDYITKLLTPMSQAHSRNLRSSERNELYVPFSQSCIAVHFLARHQDYGTHFLKLSEMLNP